MIVSLIRMIRAFSIKLRDDYVAAFASQAAFFIILAFFPFVMFLLTIINYLPFSQEDVIALCSRLIPDAINSFIIGLINELYTKASGTIISLSVITALWSASRGFLAIIRGLNSVYNNKETRNYFLLRILSSLYTLVFAILLIICFALLVFGNQIYLYIQNKFPFLSEFALLVISMRTIVLLITLSVFFLIIYMVIPNRRSKIRYELPGALVSACAWMGFSYLFSFYIDNMGNYSYMYGSMTAIALCMLWLYACMYIMFIGAEINVVLSSPNVRKAGALLLSHFKSKKSKKPNK